MATAPVLPAVPASQFATKNDASHAPINLVQLDFTLDDLLPSTHGDPASLAVQNSELSVALRAQEPEPPIRASDGPKKLRVLSRARPALHLLTDASLVSATGSSHTHDAELVSDDDDDSEPEPPIPARGGSFVDITLRVIVKQAMGTLLAHDTEEPHGTTIGPAASSNLIMANVFTRKLADSWGQLLKECKVESGEGAGNETHDTEANA